MRGGSGSGDAASGAAGGSVSSVGAGAGGSCAALPGAATATCVLSLALSAGSGDWATAAATAAAGAALGRRLAATCLTAATGGGGIAVSVTASGGSGAAAGAEGCVKFATSRCARSEATSAPRRTRHGREPRPSVAIECGFIARLGQCRHHQRGGAGNFVAHADSRAFDDQLIVAEPAHRGHQDAVFDREDARSQARR